MITQSEQLLALARKTGLLRSADARAHGCPPQLLIKLHQSGQLARVARGVYALPETEITQHRPLAEVCKRIPKAVICLLSALQYHEIGTQLPHEVWIALPEATQTPATAYPPLRIARLRGAA